MNIAELVFTGFNRRVAALHHDTGQIVCCFAVFTHAVALLPECQGAAQPEARQAITFKHVARGEGVAKACREVTSSDGKVVLRVEGPELKGNVRLYEAATNKPLGPVMVLSEPGLSYRLTSLAIASISAAGSSAWDTTVWKPSSLRSNRHFCKGGERYVQAIHSQLCWSSSLSRAGSVAEVFATKPRACAKCTSLHSPIRVKSNPGWSLWRDSPKPVPRRSG